jgi:hypothetical protein
VQFPNFLKKYLKYLLQFAVEFDIIGVSLDFPYPQVQSCAVKVGETFPERRGKGSWEEDQSS